MMLIRRPSGFTLVEILLASTLAAVLMGGVLAATTALSRDRRRMEELERHAHAPAVVGLIRRDLTNGAAFVGPITPDGFELVAYGGVDPSTYAANQRLSRVRYRIAKAERGRGGVLLREQAYLDDPIRRERWSEIVAVGVIGVGLTVLSSDAEAVRLGEDVGERLRAIDGGPDALVRGTRVPARMRLRIEWADGVVDRDLVLR